MKKFIKKFALAILSVSMLGFMSCGDKPSDNPSDNNGGGNSSSTSAGGVVFSKSNEFDKGSVGDATYNSDGSVTYTTTAQYSGGGYLYYIKDDKTVINLENYETIEVEFDYETVKGKWANGAKNPQWCLNVYADGGNFWSGQTLSYFGDDKASGTTQMTYKVTDSGDYVAVGIKLNAYQTGNNDSDECKVTIKSIKFNKKAGAGEDKASSDGLTDEQRGQVISITYSSKDYENGGTEATTKPANVYLPAGYNAADKDTKYPVLFLMHGVGGNEGEWQMTGNNSRIKKYMDKEVAAGTVKPFIIVCPNGRSNKDFSNCDFSNMNAFYSFGSELRNDLIPYMEANYNVKTDREGRAMAGLSMGGMQTINIGMCECLDLISWFGAFSAAPTSYEKAKVSEIITGTEFADYKINYFYNICGLQDTTAWDSHTAAAKGLDAICDKLTAGENFTWYETDGVHGFDIWFPGFENFAKIAFNK